MGMAASGITMRPVHHATALVPLVFTVKADTITHLQTGNTRREINIVGN